MIKNTFLKMNFQILFSIQKYKLDLVIAKIVFNNLFFALKAVILQRQYVEQFI